MNREIKEVTVLGSGVMGSRIACHFANIGCSVNLLDILPKELTEEERNAGLSMEDKKARNKVANEHLKNAVKSKPSPIYDQAFLGRIKTGNFEDDFPKIKDSDWVIEVVIENLEIKKKVFEKVEKYRKPGTIVTSNTSGIPIHSMLEGRSDDFCKHFCGTHFFNPPRYLELLEVIPTEKTSQEVISFLMNYGDRYLGKTTVLCKDTPAFIANRIGVFSIMSIFHLMKEMDMSVEDVDALTGPITGKPKSATFRTCDVVGIDTLVKVAKNTYDDCPEDEARELFKIPGFVETMVEKGWIGDKAGKGFYFKTKDEEGNKVINALDPDTLEYQPRKKPRFASVESVKNIDDLRDRLRALHTGMDKAAAFLRKLSYRLFAYASNRVPEIADEVYKVDDALKAGFGWELGPFETWDALGAEQIAKEMSQEGIQPAPWVKEMLEAGVTSFYKKEGGQKKYYDIKTRSYLEIPGKKELIILDNFDRKSSVWGNQGATLHDIGDGILNLEFHTKMNTMGGEVIEGINRAIEIAEKDYRGLVIGNDGQNFSAGANLGLIFMLAIEQEYDELDLAVRTFQNAMMRLRYSSVPVVAAPHGLTLGGGCELSLHADMVQASAETYIGLVEMGVGIIPAGGGTKELTLRASDSYREGAVEFTELQHRFLTIGQAKVATSAHEAFSLGIFEKNRDKVTVNPKRLIADAKRAALNLAEAGYTRPSQRTDIKVLGRSGLGAFLTGGNAYRMARYISDHDKLITEKLAWVMCGGDLSSPSYVSEQYLLDLEREAFLSLIGTKKTLERIESVLKTGKPVRN